MKLLGQHGVQGVQQCLPQLHAVVVNQTLTLSCMCVCMNVYVCMYECVCMYV